MSLCVAAAAALGGIVFAASASGNLVDESRYEALLARHVAGGRVDYAALQADRADLDAYLRDVAAVPKEAFASAPDEAQVAYLLNAYNAYTLASIVDHYPIRGGFFGGANSIKGIPGVWNRTTHSTALGDLTLDAIEHDLLRKKYGRPAVHMALVCASKGCPPLRGEPYRADRLDAQLEDQARLYLASPAGLTVSRGAVKVSRLFKWFGGDFEREGGWKAWVSARAPAADRAAVERALSSGDFGWIDYDWSLNDAKGAR